MTLNKTINQAVKQISLVALTILAIAFIGLSLLESANSPQAESRLDLMQTNLILQVSAWQPKDQEKLTLKNVLVGADQQLIYSQSVTAYETALKSNQEELNLRLKSNQDQRLIEKLDKSSQNISDLSLRLGILYAKVGKKTEAIATWEQINQKSSAQDQSTAQVLAGLWSQPGLIFPEAEAQIRASLDGWFRNQALEQLYQAQQLEPDSQSIMLASERRDLDAEIAIEKLLLTSSVTVIGGGLGVILIIGLIIQRLFFAKSSPLQPTPNFNWRTPWQLQTTWEVMVFWFIAYVAMSQIFLPLALRLLNIFPDSSWSSKDRAIFILIPYITAMAPMLLIFKGVLQKFLPLPNYLFNFKFWTWNWLGWGVGGYIAAIPIVLIVSALNQQLLGGQGGGNPLLPILAEDQNDIAKLVLWMTVAIAAPFFEELLFRGFLLPSLVSGFSQRIKSNSLSTFMGILISGLGFAIAHLNLGDILPLTALGMIMGFVYTRSQNLLAPMLLHGLWNSGTFFTLLVLGSS